VGRARNVKVAAAVIAVTGLGVVAAAPAAPSDNPPGAVTAASLPTVSIGDTITITGYVATNGVGAPGIDVTVKLYTLPQCASGPSPKTVLTTAADGTFSFTDEISVNPPLSYGFIVGLAQDPTRAPNFAGPDSCVTLQPTPKLSAKAEGSVEVNGSSFTAGVISYGSTVDLGSGSSVKLSTDVGKFKFFAAAGGSTSFVPVRVPLPKGKNKKRQFIIELRLVGGDFSACPGGKKANGFRTEAAKKPGPPRSLWGNGKGHYRTRGRYSSATVLGTDWLVEDLCNGTLTVVRRGVVRIHDFATNKTVIVTAGHRYLARPR
jgi:hypothetical protein